MSTIAKQQIELLTLLEAKEQQLKYNKISALFPLTGPYRRELYKKHVAFMQAGKDYQERAFIAANRVGKTLTGGCEMSYHLTGLYPDWWEGRRFKNAVSCWAIGVSNQTTKEVQQVCLLGKINEVGTGTIPKDRIARITKKPGVADAVETVYVKHISGELSECTFKSYEQEPETFQGTKKQVVWMDEEPKDKRIYSECMTRLMDKYNPGIIYCTFTPLFGMSDVVKSFLPDRAFPKNGVDAANPYKFVVNVSWEESPHLDDGQKAQLLSSYTPHEREARSKGMPGLGVGAIFPYSEEEICVSPFEIPPWWPRGYGMDVGWNRTVAVWGTLDPDSGIVYLYSEYYGGQAVPAIHTSSIKARGDWMWGACDPDGTNMADGTKMFQLYEQEGLKLIKADKKSVESSIFKCCQMFEAGRLKVFDTLREWRVEYRAYCRDESFKVIKKNDHLMDATRYLVFTGLDYLELPPSTTATFHKQYATRDEFTGY